MFLRQLRNELWKLFGKKRTYIGFAMILMCQFAVALAFRYTHASERMVRVLEGNGYFAQQFISTLTIAGIMLFPLAYILLPLYVSLVGGDLVAKEAEDGTLRMILSRPISRLRLLGVKWVAGAIFSAVLVMMLGVCSLLISRIWFPWGGMFVLIPNEVFGLFDGSHGLQRYASAHLIIIIKASTIMGLAFMFSCFNMKPAAATILAISFVFVNRILQEIPYFHDFQEWFLTYHLNSWQYLFNEQIPWWRIGQSLSILIGFNVTFFMTGYTVFQVRDFKA